jgi:hypothetical protein
MIIANGFLLRESSALLWFGAMAPTLAFQVREGSAPMTGSYHGPGVDHGTRIVIGDALRVDAFLTEYTVDVEPTPESTAYADGWVLAMMQTRRAAPRDERLLDGWREGCRAVDALSDYQRRARRRTIQRTEGPTREAFVRAMLLA